MQYPVGLVDRKYPVTTMDVFAKPVPVTQLPIRLAYLTIWRLASSNTPFYIILHVDYSLRYVT